MRELGGMGARRQGAMAGRQATLSTREDGSSIHTGAVRAVCLIFDMGHRRVEVCGWRVGDRIGWSLLRIFERIWGMIDG